MISPKVAATGGSSRSWKTTMGGPGSSAKRATCWSSDPWTSPSWCGRAQRMVAVAAYPTAGGISGKQARTRPSMYPAVRGRTANSSIVFEMVGVSNFAKATRSIAMQADCSAWRRLTKDNVDSGAADRSEWLSTTMSFPSSLGTRRHFPTPSLTVFIFLQLLDILTTLLGLQLGAQESSMFLGRLMRAGIKGLMEEGGTKRKVAVEKMLAASGGKMEAFYYAFGEHDVYVIAELPDRSEEHTSE